MFLLLPQVTSSGTSLVGLGEGDTDDKHCETFCDEHGCHCLIDRRIPLGMINHVLVSTMQDGRISCFCSSFAVSGVAISQLFLLRTFFVMADMQHDCCLVPNINTCFVYGGNYRFCSAVSSVVWESFSLLYCGRQKLFFTHKRPMVPVVPLL